MFPGCSSASSRGETATVALGSVETNAGSDCKGNCASANASADPCAASTRLLPADADYSVNLRYLRICGSPFQEESEEIDSSAFDKARIGLNGAIGGLSFGFTFGTFFAFNKMLSHPGTRRLAAVGPLTASVASVCLDKFLRTQASSRLSDPSLAERSVPPQPSWTIDAILPATLMVNAYTFLWARIPSAPPRSLRGAGATVAITTWGSMLAGSFRELAVQETCGRSKNLPAGSVLRSGESVSPRIRSVSGTLPDSGPPSVMQRSIGLALTQLPVVFFHVMNARGRVPARFALTGPAIGLAPLILQRVSVEQLVRLSPSAGMADLEPASRAAVKPEAKPETNSNAIGAHGQ